MELTTLTASEAAGMIRARDLSPVELVQACLGRIDVSDPRLYAWVRVDRDGALATARAREAEARGGRLRGPLHGVPVGLKDIYHAAGMPTTAGAGTFAHEHPASDAESVARLRGAGAIVVGKTATTEFAYLDPAETRNPWNREHTPGGSSSGSGASVAARMLPLALGSQTVGSVLRPAAYCGVIGLKPTHGRISGRGVLPLAWSLDHVGVFCRSVEDAALALKVLAGHDPADPYSVREPVADYPSACASVERPPRLGLLRQFFLEKASAEVVGHLEAVAQAFSRAGAEVDEVKLPQSFETIHAAGITVLQVEAATYHAPRFTAKANHYRPKIRALIEAGMKISGVEYVGAQQRRRTFREEMTPILEPVDALLMPVAPTPAPKDLTSTGDPTFCGPWSFAGLPAISLPSGLAQDGLPLAIQLVSGAFGETRLLATARWCEATLAFSASPREAG